MFSAVFISLRSVFSFPFLFLKKIIFFLIKFEKKDTHIQTQSKKSIKNCEGFHVN